MENVILSLFIEGMTYQGIIGGMPSGAEIWLASSAEVVYWMPVFAWVLGNGVGDVLKAVIRQTKKVVEQQKKSCF